MEIPEKAPLSALQVKDSRFQNHVSRAASDNGQREDDAREDDTVDLSYHLKNMKEMMRSVDSVPDVREDKVMAMKRRIESGGYKVACEHIAANLISETMENNDILDQIGHVCD